MNKLLLAAALLAGLWAAPAGAQSKVGDWTIEKRGKDARCSASRGYNDADDEDRYYGIVITYSTGRIAIVLVYDGWAWESAGRMLRADFTTDKDEILKKSKWEVMNEAAVRGVFEVDQRIMDRLSRSNRLSLDFEEDENESIEFETPRAAEMLAALKSCEESRK
ncbi:MAG: hypothetical protein GY844_16615 [Bradyrhizobium sp.]|nr:hypothetical protein [Bradyrhizobium sp.]